MWIVSEITGQWWAGWVALCAFLIGLIIHDQSPKQKAKRLKKADEMLKEGEEMLNEALGLKREASKKEQEETMKKWFDSRELR
jgi:hypothetical protein